MLPTIINSQKLSEANVVLLGIPFDRSSGLSGADNGPEAVRKMLNEQIELYEPITGTSPAEYLGIYYERIERLKRVSAESMVKTVKSVASAARLVGKFPIAIGGDHSVSIGILQAMAEIHKDNLPTILQIDAHFDLRDNDSDFRELPIGRYAHCCVMRRAAEMGFPIVTVGVRSFSSEELTFAKKHRIKFFPWFTFIPPEPTEIIASIPSQNVYLTLDIDGIDPAHMPATGTPVQGGLSWQYILKLLISLFRSKNVIGMDVVEVAPSLETTNLTAYGAAQLIYTAIALKFDGCRG